jgi:hypothetical protein
MAIVIAGAATEDIGHIASPATLTATEWFLSVWLRANANADTRVFYSAGDGWEIGLSVAGVGAGNGGLSVYTGDGWRNDSSGDDFTGATWYHLVVERLNDGLFKFRSYKDGTLHHTSVGTNMQSLASTHLYMGAEISGANASSSFEVAEVSFWDKGALGSGETVAQVITALAAGESPLASSRTPLAYTRFANNTDLTDLTGNGNTWTLSGSPANAGTDPGVDDPPAGGSTLPLFMNHYQHLRNRHVSA